VAVQLVVDIAWKKKFIVLFDTSTFSILNQLPIYLLVSDSYMLVEMEIL